MSATDRNLLYGVLALQMDFVSRDQLVAAMNAWAMRKDSSLGDILRDQKALDDDTHVLLQSLTNKHLALHNDDAKKSLAALESTGTVRDDLKGFAIEDVEATLMQAVAGRPRIRAAKGQATEALADPNATAPFAAAAAGQRFHILRPYAEGALGRVSVALDDELHREVALKEIQDRYADDEECRRRFIVEAEITGGLEHPGIVPVYGLGQYADGRPFYAMRLVRGTSLHDAIKQFHDADTKGRDPGQRSLALRDLLGRFVTVCHAMQYAHDRGVLHRDLKPGNIMLGDYGETLVVDWGLAKATGLAHDTVSDLPALEPASKLGTLQTQAGAALGTPAFMSPEQALGRQDLVGPASDVYSLGATLFNILTGRAPFEDMDGILRKVGRGEFSAPSIVKPGLAPALEAICLKAMALKTADRYASPRALADDLEHWLADEPVGAWPEALTVKAKRLMRRHKALTSAAAAALIVALIGSITGALWYQDQQAASAHKRMLDHQAAQQSLERARHTYDALLAALRVSGGVQGLLNEPARWESQIKSARADGLQAHFLATRSGESVDPEVVAVLREWDALIAGAESDFLLAQHLEEIRLATATLIDNKFDYGGADQSYRREFDDAGLAIVPGVEARVATRIQESPIKDQLVAALDHWAYSANLSNNRETAVMLMRMARLADPDPWRDRIRDPSLWNSAALADLVAEGTRDANFAANLSPQLLHWIGLRLPVGKTRETWLRKAQAAHPADFWLNFELAWLLYHNKTHQDALEASGFYRVALALRPDTIAVHNNLGLTLWAQKNLPAAIDAYNKALALNPRYAYAWNNLGLALREQKNLPAAIDAFQKALAIDTRYATAWSNLGLAYWDQKKLSASIDASNKALAIDPRHAYAWNNLGLALRDQKKLPAAIAAFNKALAIDPKFAAASSNLELSRRTQQDLASAVDRHKKTLAANSQNATVWIALALALESQNDLSAAIEAYNKALAIDPGIVEANNNLAWIHATCPDDKYWNGAKAVELAQKAIALDDKARNWDTLAAAHAAAGNFAEAVRCQQRALMDTEFALTHGDDARRRLSLYQANKAYRRD